MNLVLGAAVAAILLVSLGFFVAAVHFRIRNIRKADFWGGLEARWQPVIVAVLAGTREPSELTRLVDPAEELYFVDFLYRYARRLRGSERAILGGMARPFLAPIAARIQSGDAERRARAVQTLAILDFDHHAPAIASCLDDPSPLVAMIAARTLAANSGSQHLGLVLERMGNFQSWSQKFQASMLASAGPAAIPLLEAALVDRTQSIAVRAVVADALRQLGSPRSADVAAEALAEEHDPEIVAPLLRLLRRLGRPEHLPSIRPLIDSPSFVIRAQAISALGQLGSSAEAATLRTAVEDESLWVALHAARGLRDVGHFNHLYDLIGTDHERADVARQALTEAT